MIEGDFFSMLWSRRVVFWCSNQLTQTDPVRFDEELHLPQHGASSTVRQPHRCADLADLSKDQRCCRMQNAREARFHVLSLESITYSPWVGA